MKKYILAGFIAFAAIAFTASSCKKYEDGPAISLLTKKMRLCNDWVVDKYLENGTDETNGTDMTSFMQSVITEWSIKKDNSYTITGAGSESGTWSLGEDKDDVTFTPSSGTARTFRILMLKSKELRLRQTNTNGTYNYLFLKQK
ncbi:MAG TPA: lipocalin family protein [Bacteroidia bacterium]|nr:lipocalin family protein [Bacteroidia bacterium]